MHYIFCPQCGAKLVDKAAGDEGDVPFCEVCARYWFDSFSSCAIVMVVNDCDEIALLRQNYLSEKYMNFVSGYIAPGETAEETAMREVREEIGISLERLEYAGTHWFTKNEVLMHGFIGYAAKSDFTKSDEVDDVQWVPAEKIVDFIFPDGPGNAMHPIYRQYMSGRKSKGTLRGKQH